MAAVGSSLNAIALRADAIGAGVMNYSAPPPPETRSQAPRVHRDEFTRRQRELDDHVSTAFCFEGLNAHLEQITRSVVYGNA